MKAPLKQDEYPRYFKTSKALLAFTGPDKMFKIENIGSNMNPGVTIDHYTTRNMVLKHWPSVFFEIRKEEFMEMFEKLYAAYLKKMIA